MGVRNSITIGTYLRKENPPQYSHQKKKPTFCNIFQRFGWWETIRILAELSRRNSIWRDAIFRVKCEGGHSRHREKGTLFLEVNAYVHSFGDISSLANDACDAIGITDQYNFTGLK